MITMQDRIHVLRLRYKVHVLRSSRYYQNCRIIKIRTQNYYTRIVTKWGSVTSRKQKTLYLSHIFCVVRRLLLLFWSTGLLLPYEKFLLNSKGHQEQVSDDTVTKNLSLDLFRVILEVFFFTLHPICHYPLFALWWSSFFSLRHSSKQNTTTK